jgi:hypothetical protein
MELNQLENIPLKNKNCHQQTLQAIWGFGLIEKWFCVWDDFANPKNRLSLVPNCL